MISRRTASIAPRPLTARLIGTAALGAAVLLGTTGCAFSSTQATTIPYSPAEGVNVPDTSGVLEVRNALIVADEDGVDGNLVMAIVNSSDATETLNIEFGEDGEGGSATVRVRGGEVLSLGAEGNDPLLLEGIDSKPGTTLPVFFQSGDGAGALIMVPVLDGALPYLADLVP